jgi:hypothetical protein
LGLSTGWTDLFSLLWTLMGMILLIVVEAVMWLAANRSRPF